MKKSFLLLLIILLIFGMTACDSSIDREILFAPDGDYSIEMEGDICYLAITDRKIKNKIKREEIEHEILTANGWYINIASSILKFCSVEELKEKVLNGGLSYDEKLDMARFERDDSGDIPIYDLTKLYSPTFHEGTKVKYVTWGGSDIVVQITDPELFEDGQFFMYSPSITSYESVVEGIGYLSKLEPKSVIGEEVQRNATIYKLSENTRKVVYEINTGELTFTVSEKYNSKLSTEIPTWIEVIGKAEDCYYCLVITNPQARPSLEWFESISLKALTSN